MKEYIRQRSPAVYIKVISLLLLIGICMYLFTAIYVGVRISYDNSKSADAIIILGASSYWGEQINPCLRERVMQGVDLYKKIYAPLIIVTGGYEEKTDSYEAVTMKALAIEAGIPEQNIRVEQKATSTYENILFTKELLDSSKAETVIVVTENYHSPRALLVAEKHLDQKVFVSPVQNSTCWQQGGYVSRYFLREPFALLFYIATGKI